MSRMKTPQQQQEVKRYLGAVYGVIERKCPNIREALDWMITNLGEHERISIVQWVGPLFYLEALDTRIGKFCSSQRFALTVDMDRDVIRFNDDESNDLPKGNCFVRAWRWKKLPRVQNIGKDRIAHYRDWKVFTEDETVEQARRDEKRGLFGEHEDIAN